MDPIDLKTYRNYLVNRIKEIKQLDAEVKGHKLCIDTCDLIRLYDSHDRCMKELYLIDSGAYDQPEKQ